MYCRNCGVEFEGNFCPNCGHPSTSSDSSRAKPSAQSPEWFAIDVMEGIEFENYCVSLLSKYGFSDLKTTQASGDQGVDIIGVKNGVKYAIQCKRYSSPLGNSPIQEVNAGKVFYDCQAAAVMTNSTFTSGAKELAEKTGVLLWDRNVLSTLIALSEKPKEQTASLPSVEESALYQALKENNPHLEADDLDNTSASDEYAISTETHRRYCDAISYLMRRSKVSKMLLQAEYNWPAYDAENAMALLSYSGLIESSVGIQKPLQKHDYMFLFRQGYIADNLPDGYYEGISRVVPESKVSRFFLAALRISFRVWGVFCKIFRLIISIFKKIHGSRYRNAWYTLICLAIIGLLAS